MVRFWLMSVMVALVLSGCGGSGGGSSTGDGSSVTMEVSSLSPVDGATDVALDTALSATLSQEIDCSAIPTDPMVLVDAANNTVTGSVSCSGTTLTFTPDTTLAYSTTYSATLKAGISEAASAAVLDIPVSWSFTTLADTVAPTTPTVNSSSVGDSTPTVSGTFDASDYAGGFVVQVNGVSYTMDTDAALSHSGNNWSLTIPTGNELSLGSYDVVATATDGAGNSASDTTSGELTVVDLTAPTVSSTTPAGSATDVALTTTITATFNEVLNCTTVDTSSFTLADSGGASVTGSISCSGSGVSFTPNADLAYATDYTAILTTAITDTAGNPLASAYSWNFTTLPDTTAPTVSITSHSDGDTFTATHTVTISGAATDNDAIANLTVSVNGGSATPLTLSGASFSTDLTFTSDSNAVVVTATDTTGNSSSASVNLYYVATGLLDTSFNSMGYNTLNVANSHDSANAIAMAADGSFYLAGYAGNGTGTGYDMALWHYNSDGSLDTGFNSTGYVLLAGPAGGTGHDFANDVTLDANGKIVMAGHSINAAGDDDMVLARYNTDGTLDTTFGGDINTADGTPDGFVVVDVGSGSADEGDGVAIDASGNIYVAGTSNAAGDNDLMLWKFTSSGALDTSFAGGAGYLSYDSGGVDNARALTMDANGNLLVTGQAGSGMVIWRVTPTGVSDTSFNGTGVVLGVATNVAEGNAITTDADGNILVAGYMVVNGSATDMSLWRYTSDGTPDTSFGGDYDINGTPDGYVTHDGAGVGSSNDYDYGYAVTTDAAGNILVSGSSVATHSGAVKLDMVVWRFTKAGELDHTFGDDVNLTDGIPDGFFTHNSAAGGNNADQGNAILVDSLGRVVVVGSSCNDLVNSDVAIWRLY